MIPLTSPPGQRIYLKTMTADEELLRGIGLTKSEAAKRGAHEVVQYITDKCITETHDEKKEVTILEINAVVMTEKDYQDAIAQAYMRGVQFARQTRMFS